MKDLIMTRHLFVSLLALSAATGIAKADRPLVTETPETVKPGNVVVETGLTRGALNGTKFDSFGELTVTTGVTPNLEVAAVTTYLHVRDRATGLTDSAIRVKYALTPKLSLLAGTSLPTGNKVYSTRYQPGVGLSFRQSLGSRVDFLTNIGYIRTATISRHSNSLVGTAAVTKGFGKSMAFAEVFGAGSNSGGDGTGYAVGLAHDLSDRVKVDARVGQSLRNVRGQNYFVGVGLTYKLK